MYYYLFNPSYQTHDFAIYLTRGKLAYPSTVIIPAGDGPPQVIPGYLTVSQMQTILTYFGDGHYGKIPFEEFQKNLNPPGNKPRNQAGKEIVSAMEFYANNFEVSATVYLNA